MRRGSRVKSAFMNLQKKNDTPFVRRRLLRLLACALGAAVLAASSARAAVTIGHDPMVHGNAGFYMGFKNNPIYVPFVFNLGSPYTLDSVQVPFIGGYSDAGFFLGITPTLGTDLSLPSEFTPLSLTATSPLADSAAMVFTFSLDSPAVFTSGVTYYLRMAYVGAEDPGWVSSENLSGDIYPGDPSTSGGTSGGPPGGVTLTPLMTLHAGRLTFRQVQMDAYMDREEFYQLSLTASAVPEPTTFAMAVVGLTLGAALLFRLRRRR